MSLEVINDDDTVECGYVYVGRHEFAMVGLKRSARGVYNGIAFNSKRNLDAAIAFLQRARREMYGEPVEAKPEPKAEEPKPEPKVKAKSHGDRWVEGLRETYGTKTAGAEKPKAKKRAKVGAKSK